MQFLRKSAWSFSSVLFKGIGALAINKIFAVYFGTAGITMLAHFQNLISIFTQIPSDGINRGLINNWANPEVSEEEKQEILSSGILLTAISFTIIMIVVFINKDFFIEPFVQFISRGIFLIIIIFSIIAILANALVQSLIIANKRVKAYSVISIISIGVLLIFLVWAVNYRMLEIAFIAYALGNSISLIFSLFYFSKGMGFKIILPEPTQASIRNILHFIAMAVSVLVFGKLVDFYIRDASIEWFGMTSTGHWQSLVKLSDAYVMVFIGTIGVVFFPEVSSKINQPQSLFRYLKQVLWMVVPTLAVGLLILFMLGEPVLKLLFAEEFLPAYALMPFQLIGDFFMLSGYLFAYILMAKKQTRTYVILQAVSAMVYLLTIFFFKDSIGIQSILVGHMSRNIIFFAILLVLIRKI